MRYRVKCVVTTLHVRSGPSVSYSIVGNKYNGNEFIVDNIVSYDGGEYWYRIEGTSQWCCGYRPSVHKYKYINVTADLSNPPPAPAPQPPPAPPKPTVDYGAITRAMGDQNTGRLAPWDVKFEYQFGAGSGSKANTVLMGYTGQTNYRPDLGGPALMNGNGSTVSSVDLTRSGIYLDPSRYGIVDLNKFGDQDLLFDASFIKDQLYIAKYNIGANYFKGFGELRDTMYHKFNRFRTQYPDYTLSKAFPFIYFTRPDMNILDSNGRLVGQTKDAGGNVVNGTDSDPYFLHLYMKDPNMLKVLCGKSFSGSHDFNLFLSSNVASIEIPDEAIKTNETAENVMGYRGSYGANNHTSLSAGTFNVTYTDSKALTISEMHKAWIEYISQVYKGQILAKKEYREQRVIDYACAVYFFLCGEDGQTIIYGHKYIGVYPTNVPNSAISWSKGSLVNQPEITITYEYWFRESMSLLTMGEFNLLSTEPKNYAKAYDPETGLSGNPWVGTPWIEAVKMNDGTVEYKLRHRQA